METTLPRANHLDLDGRALPDGAVHAAAVNLHGAVDMMATSAGRAAAAVQPGIDRATVLAHQTVDKVADAAAPTATWLAAQRSTLARTQHDVVADARVYVAANPWQSLALALAAGILLGRWTR